jgi:hypothetical protein
VTPDERFALVSIKLNRAYKHILDLDIQVRDFLEGRPYVARPEHDAKSRKRTFYFQERHPVTTDIVATFGDAVHNLRSALDHLVWQLVEANGGKPNSKTEFPIFENAKEYVAKKAGKIQGIGNKAIDLIDSIGPYKERRISLWWLHKLDILDKHRTLLAAGIRPMGHSASPRLKEKIAEGMRTASFPNQAVRNISQLFVAIPIVGGVLKDGDVLITGPDSEVQDNMEFVFYVALNEPGIIEPRPIVPVAQSIAKDVNRVVSILKPCL